MWILKKSSYHQGKEKWYIKLIRGLFYKYVNEIYLPDDTEIKLTYKGKDKNRNDLRGLCIFRTQNCRGVQEEYFDMPKDLLK